MFQNSDSLQYVYTFDFIEYFKSWVESPINLIVGILDIAIVIFLLYQAVRLLKKTRAWQLLKGIAILVILTLVTGVLHFGILNAVLTTVMTYRSIYSYSCISTRT
jgi:DNA integrity scanning protein DisA with diadenylate cyclase activity